MAIEIASTMALNRAQTIAGLILSILGIGWFIFLSNVVKIKALHRIKSGGGLPILESIVPTNLIEVIKILRVNMTAPIILICMMVMMGLMLTVFDSLIIPNTIEINELCEVVDVKTQAQILNDRVGSTPWAYFEVEEMRIRRKNSGVPDDVLVGQIPSDTRWKFNRELDVEPYPWRTSCSLYNTGMTQVTMNTTVITAPKDVTSMAAALPEVHEEFAFLNAPKGYQPMEWYFYPYIFYNTTINGEKEYNGALIIMKESFMSGNTSEVGGKYVDRLWTLRVPEETKILVEGPVIITVPIEVKAYTCEMERVKEGNRGSVALLYQGTTGGFLQTVGSLIANKWWVAIIKKEDTSLYEFTPDYWTSFLNVQGSRQPQVEEVSAQIYMPCVRVHNIYLLLVCMYVVLTIIGIICWCTVLVKDFKIPSSSVEWASLACKESTVYDDNPKQAKLGVVSNDIKILPNKGQFP